MLSVDDGDRVTAQDSWQRHCAKPDCKSAGVWACIVQDASDCDLPVIEDPVEDNADHVLVDFRAFPEKQQKAKAKLLSIAANARGCLFKPA